MMQCYAERHEKFCHLGMSDGGNGETEILLAENAETHNSSSESSVFQSIKILSQTNINYISYIITYNNHDIRYRVLSRGTPKSYPEES